MGVIVTHLGDGVYVSRIDTADWEPDVEVGGSAHMLFEEGDAKVGLWRAEPGMREGPSDPIELPARETVVVLEGTVTFGVVGGRTLELSAGDMASVPRGSRVTWDPSPGCKVIWIYS